MLGAPALVQVVEGVAPPPCFLPALRLALARARALARMSSLESQPLGGGVRGCRIRHPGHRRQACQLPGSRALLVWKRPRKVLRGSDRAQDLSAFLKAVASKFW